MVSNSPTVIVGNGAAAIEAIKALRENGYRNEIHVISDSTYPAYNPMLTTYLVAGRIPLDNCFPFGRFDFYRKYDVRIHLGQLVTALNAERQIVETKNGKTLSYSQCLIASGASPIIPPARGISSRNVHVLRTVEDAIQLREALARRPGKALVVGASMVGIKVVDLLHRAGVEVCLADMAEHVFPQMAHPDCAGIVEGLLLDRGVRLRMGAGIEAIEETDAGLRAYFRDRGEPEPADLAVICVGVRPNVEFLDRSQVEIDQGIVVNEKMETSAPGLYAAGDVAQGTNLLTGRKQVIGLWSNARYQGRTAGRNMAGVADHCPGSIPQNISRFLDIVFVGIGDMTLGTREERYREGERYRHLVWDGQRLVGVNLLNDFLDAGVVKHALVKGLACGKAFEANCFPWAFLERLARDADVGRAGRE